MTQSNQGGRYVFDVPVKNYACETANKEPGGKCLGYSRAGDDEPVEKCKACPRYTGFEEE